MTTTEIPSSLVDVGWKLISSNGDLTVLERLSGGRAVRAVGQDLDAAVEDARALDERLGKWASHARSAHGVVTASGQEASVRGHVPTAAVQPRSEPFNPESDGIVQQAPSGVGQSDLQAGRFEQAAESDPSTRSDLTPGRVTLAPDEQ